MNPCLSLVVLSILVPVTNEALISIRSFPFFQFVPLVKAHRARVRQAIGSKRKMLVDRIKQSTTIFSNAQRIVEGVAELY